MPVLVSNLNDATAITAGHAHTCALKADHTVACWGYNISGQLGNGNTGTDSNVPVPVSNLNDATAVTAGGYHTCALKADQTVACWGENLNGQLGDGTATDSNVPMPVSNLDDAAGVTGGTRHTCALKADHTVACWGLNNYGRLGNGGTTNSSVPVLTLGIPYAATITP